MAVWRTSSTLSHCHEVRPREQEWLEKSSSGSWNYQRNEHTEAAQLSDSVAWCNKEQGRRQYIFLYFCSGLQFQTRIQGRPGHQLIWILPMTSQHNHLSIRYRKRWHHLTPATQWRHCELLAGHPDSSLLTLRKSSSTERGSLEAIVLFEMWQINSFVQVFIATWQLALYLSRTFSLHHTIWGLTQQFDFVFKSR